MTFPKDILLIDFETTGDNLIESDPIQIGAVLLDKNTLEEKIVFNSYIHADLSKVDPEFIKEWHIPVDKVAAAPNVTDIAKTLLDKFGNNVILASWCQSLDGAMLRKIFRLAEMKYPFDYHFLDLWPVTYIYLLQHDYKGSMDSDEMFAWFGVPKRDAHDALEDCEIEASVLRKIIFDSKDAN